MPSIVTYSPLHPPVCTPTDKRGESIVHKCRDSSGHEHRTTFSLGSVRGIFYLDALCPHCGAHLVWVDDNEPDE